MTTTTLIDWHATMRPQPGQTVCGDNYLVEPYEGGILVAVVDGLGHGAKAADASAAAVEALKKRPHDHVTDILEYCHRATRQTRGNVMSIASIKANGSLTWIGIGNVSALVVRHTPDSQFVREHLLLRGGVVGYRLPPLRPFSLALNPNDTLIFATDGIRSAFTEHIPFQETPKKIADSILERHSRETDDATVLVARYVNSS